MSPPSNTEAELRQENVDLRARLEEADETLRAIRAGEVDALVVGDQVYSLKGVETPYRILVQAMNEAAATLTPDGTLFYCNGRLAEMLGVPQDQIIGVSLRSLVTPADQPKFDALLAESRQCSAKGEVALERRHGPPVPVLLSLNAMKLDDGGGFGAVITDLTERKRAEVALRQANEALEQRVIARTGELQRERERLSVTLQRVGDGLIATDAAGRVTLINPVAAALTGWSTNEALGQPVQSVFRTHEEKTRAPGEDIVGRVLSEKRIVMLANNLAVVTRDGREVPVEASAAPIKDHQGKPVGVVLVFRDVTEKSRAKHVLEAHARELEWLNKAMLGRELRMIELKKEINELCRKSGAPTRYDV